MELKELADMLRAAGVRRAAFGPAMFGLSSAPSGLPIAGSMNVTEIELFDTIPAPAPTERPPADGIDLAEALGLEPGTEVKEAGVCCVRGCSNTSGGAMAGRIAPEMCRDCALQMGGARG